MKFIFVQYVNGTMNEIDRYLFQVIWKKIIIYPSAHTIIDADHGRNIY